MFGLARLLIAAFLVLAPLTAVAQHKHAENEIGPHGGPVEHIGDLHAELVLKGSTVQVYLYDGNMKPRPAQGTEVTVTLQTDGKRETIKLQVAGANLMEGRATVDAGKGTRSIVALRLPGKPVVQARFSQN